MFKRERNPYVTHVYRCVFGKRVLSYGTKSGSIPDVGTQYLCVA
jgi:hypothetical protein